jgi:DNA primase
MRTHPLDAVHAHYQRVVPMLTEFFGRIPIAVVGRDDHGEHVFYHDVPDGLPATVPTVQAETISGEHRCLALDRAAVAWAVEHLSAIEIESWTPFASDFTRPRFARIVLSRRGNATLSMLAEGVVVFEAALRARSCDVVLLNEGAGGTAVWFAVDAPDYASLRAWLGPMVKEIAAAHSGLFTIAQTRAEEGQRIYVGAHTNAPGCFTALPLSILDARERFVVTPISSDEIAQPDVRLGGFAGWLNGHPDVFAGLRASKPRSIPASAPTAPAAFDVSPLLSEVGYPL